MECPRKTSLDPVKIIDWQWQDFLDDTTVALSDLGIEPYPVPKVFLERVSQTKKGNQTDDVKISTWACKSKKLRQVRAACLCGGPSLSVFNLVFSPSIKYDMPFFGADFVSLPSGYLLALDFQPVLKHDKKHTEFVWERLIPLHKKWQQKLPSGGPIPDAAKEFFSPAFLWTRLPDCDTSRQLICNILRPAFNEYLNLYLELLLIAPQVDSYRSNLLRKGQMNYLTYRSSKDPARPMLTRLYGRDWSESYIHKTLFDLSCI